MAGINFVADQQRLASEQAKKDHQYLMIALAVLGVVLLAWGGFFGYNMFLLEKSDSLGLERDRKMTDLEGYATSQTPYFVFVNKVKVIAEVIANRHEGLQRIEETGNYINESGIRLRSANYKMRDRFFESNIEATDVFQMEKLYEKLTAEDFRQNYESIDYGSLSRNSTAKYSTSMKFNI